MGDESIKQFLDKIRYGSGYIFYKKLFENKLSNLIAFDNRLSLNVLGKLEYDTYQNCIIEKPYIITSVNTNLF